MNWIPQTYRREGFVKKHLQKRREVLCTAGELIEFAGRVWLKEFSIEFEIAEEWNILEIVEDENCYAVNGEMFPSFAAMAAAYTAQFHGRLKVLKFTVPVRPIFQAVRVEAWRYVCGFLLLASSDPLEACPQIRRPARR